MGANAPDQTAGGRRTLRASGVIAVVIVLALAGWWGWTLVRNPHPGPAEGQVSGSEGEVIAVDPASGVTLELLGWQRVGDVGTATLALRNDSSAWSEFVVDVAAVGAAGRPTYGYGTVVVDGLSAGSAAVFTAEVPSGVPDGSLLGVANLWGRVPGDPQIHAIALGAGGATSSAAGPDGGANTPEASADAVSESTSAATESELLAIASEFATKLGAVQSQCREDTSLAGLVCLSRRNFPDYLLPEQVGSGISGTPYFHQVDSGDGPPRAFEMRSAGGAVVCVGQRIDKQTSAQVAILGSCSQRGLYPGAGSVVGAIPAGTSAASDAASSTVAPARQLGAGGLPVVPEGSGAAGGQSRPPGIGDSVGVGGLTATVTGVQVDLTEVDGLPSSPAGYAVVDVALANPSPVALSWQVDVLDGSDVLLRPVSVRGTAGGSGPSEATGVLAPGERLIVTLIFDLAAGQTPARLVITAPTSGEQASVSLWPPPS